MVKSFIFFLILTFHLVAFAVEKTPQSFSLDGRLYQTSSEEPLLDSGTLVIQVLNPAQTCILYEETQSFDTTASDGNFNIHIGSQTSDTKRGTADRGNTLKQIFSNTGSSAINGKLTADGTTSCTYTAASGDTRRIRIKVIPSDMVVRTLSPDMYVDSVPNAIVAESAETLQGLTPSQVLQIGSQQLTQSNVQNVFSNSNYPILTSLLAGSSTDYVQVDSKGANLPSLAADPAGAANGQIWYDTTANVIKYKDNSGIKTLGVSGGSVTSVIAGTGLSGGTITSTGTISMPNTGTAGTYTKVTTDAQGRVSSGTTLSESDIPTLSTAGKVSGDAINTGTIAGNTVISTTGTVSALGVSARVFDAYDSDNSNFVRIQTPATGFLTANYTLTLPIDDGVSGQYLITDGSGNLSWSTPPHCNANEKLEISAGPMYAWSCVSESASAILADADNNTKIQVEESANEDKIRFDTAGSERMIIDEAGNVGIGTTSPAEKLHVAGNVKISALSALDIYRIDTDASNYVRLRSFADANGFNIFSQSAGTGAGNTQNLRIGTAASAHVALFTNNSERLRIDSTGSVGIGTTAPGTLLDVAGAITSRPYGTNPGETGQIIMRELAANGTNTATLRVPDTLGADYTLTLPVDDGTNGQVLITDGAGVLSWSTLAAVGETNTASNVTGSTGIGVFKQKTGVDLEFKSLLPGSTKLSISGGVSDVTLDVVEANINHDNLSGFVANEHVDHSAVSIATAADSGLTGGGDLTATRNLAVDINGTTAETVPASGDSILMYDTSATALRKITRSNFLTGYLQAAIGTSAGDVMDAGGVPNCTATQKLQMSAGPVYTWSCVSEATSVVLADADNNTKIQVEESANEDKIRFDTAGSERMIIDNAGNVGIGTTSPTQELTVHTESVNADVQVNSGDVVNNARIDFFVTPTNGDVGGLAMYGNRDMVFGTDNNTERMRITKSGLVGIGTTNPGANKLLIYDDVNSGTGMKMQNPNSGTGAYSVISNSADANTVYNYSFSSGYTTSGRFEASSGLLEASGSGGLGLAASSGAGAIKFYTVANNERMRITSGGNVGIGTTSPGAPLHIHALAGSNPNIRLTDGDVSGVSQIYLADNALSFQVDQTDVDANSTITFGVDGSERARITSNGRVGIGTTIPGTTLDVAGAITSRPYGTNPGETGQIIMRELAANGTNTATLRVPDTLGTDYTLTLPVDDGTNGQVLTTDGAGVLSWSSAPGGGEINTASNVTGSTGVGLFKQKTVLDLEFKSLLPGSTKLSISGGASDVTLDVVEANINHDNLSGFVANEHVDHSAVSIATAADSGLTGGGDLTATRSLAMDINGTTAETVPAGGDSILMYDTSATALRKITRSNFLSGYLLGAIGTSAGDVMGADSVPNCTASQKLQMSAGPVYTWSCVSEATPTLISDADGNTKIQTEESANEDKIRFDTAGSERMIIDNSGNVGIGSTSPGAKLDVNGAIKVGTTGVACDSTVEGTMRYNSVSKIMQYCNGTYWISMAEPLVSTFTANGTWTRPTVGPSSTTRVQCWGGGGGGGGVTTAASCILHGGGGGGGAYNEYVATTSTLPASVSVTIGQGGSGGSAAGGNGTAGTNTVFGALLTAYGGGRGGGATGSGTCINFGGNGGGGGVTGIGGNGAAASGSGIDTGADGAGGASGGGTGPNGLGTLSGLGWGGDAGYYAYNGGASKYGGAGGTNNPGGSATKAGSSPGAGGAGGTNSYSSDAGGAGADGQCIVTVYP